MLSHNSNNNSLSCKSPGHNAEGQQKSSCLRLHYFPEPATPQQALRRHIARSGLEPTHIPSSVRCPTVADPFGRVNPPPPPVFHWLVDRQANNNSAESSSRKVAATETYKRELENWYYMHFRIRIEGYQALVNAIKQSAKDESIFNEEHLDKWTIKLRFRIRQAAALKEALHACSARLGLSGDPNVLFCMDGFYGDFITGRIGNSSEVPNRVVQPTYTSRAMGLRNGSCLFVSRVTSAERENATAQMRLDIQREEGNDDDESIVEESESSGKTSVTTAPQVSPLVETEAN